MNNLTGSPTQIVRGSQIIAGALIAGTIIFAAVAVGSNGGLDAESTDTLISTIMAVLSLPQLLLFLFLPLSVIEGLLENQLGGRSNLVTPENKPYQTMQLSTIFRCALLEGGCFMNLIAYIVEHNWWSLGIVGVFVLFMLSNFPTETRFKHYAESQQAF